MRKNFIILVSFFVTLLITLPILFSLYAHYQEGIPGDDAVDIIAQLWHIEGNKTLQLKGERINPQDLENKDILSLTYDLHGLCLLGDAASDIMLIDTKGQLHDASLTDFGKNCFNGQQTVNIPFSSFSNYSPDLRFSQFELSFWYPTSYSVDFERVIAYNSVLGANTQQQKPVIFPSSVPSFTPTPTTPPQPEATANPILSVSYQSWPIQSVSSMKETKDKVCEQRSSDFIQHWVDTAKDLGANYISIETPYDNPNCGNSVAYTKLWISIIRSRGLKVWHRSVFTSFEGIYNTPKDASKDYLQLIADYIKANPEEYQAGDIFTPIPEPQNGGIQGVTYCSQSTCLFSSAKAFNIWIRKAMDTSETAFAAIGLGGKVKIGYFGFDGFVAWGDHNKEWHGILEPATIAKMGNITIDHYPEIVGETMQYGLNQLQAKYPSTPIVIGEWGTITANNTVQQVFKSMSAAKRKNVVGFNYWHMGMGGNEALINEDFSHKPTFEAVESFYKSTKP